MGPQGIAIYLHALEEWLVLIWI